MAKREQGYMVSVKMFVPVNTKDLTDTKDKADAIHKAQASNDLSGLAAAGADVMEVKQRWTSRERAEAAAVHEPAQTVEEIAEEAKNPATGDPIVGESEGDRIRREHAQAEAAAEAEENEGGHAVETGADQAEATEAAASGRKRR